jgi:putative endonuclease
MATTRDAGNAPRGTPHRTTLGRRGEDVAAAHLAAHGLVVLERNWRCREGELDVVAADGDCLVVVEVKSRSGTGFGAAEAVTPAKAARIRRLAQRWLAARHAAGGSGFAEVRFDVVAVLLAPGAPPRVEHYEGAF